ncbi:hypothetical protein ABEB36_005942 [Hypothenemus hampei]
MALRMEQSKKESLELQLQDALQENQQILSDAGLQGEFGSAGRSVTNLGSSISTISLVHLQYKYEELLASNRGLLKALENRNSEVKKHIKENNEFHEKIEKLTFELGTAKDKVTFLERKLNDVRRRKRAKISRLKAERQTLTLVHRRLVALLHRECMEKNDFIESLLRTTTHSEKGLLLEEIRKNNMLTYENFRLQQEVDYFKSLLNLSKSSSRITVKNNS